MRSRSGEHVIDGRPLDVVPHTITLIGRGQVHVFARARHVTGATVRFNDDVLHGDGSEQMIRSWLFSDRGGRSVPVPVAKVGALQATSAALAAEAAAPADMRSTEVQRHLLAVLLHWSERWYDAVRSQRPDDANVRLHRRFAALLEDDFALRRDAGHYADALGVPPAKLSRALSRVTGRSTKELILDRVMIEAARLVRFTDMAVGQIAAATGFSDPLYFSRVFKRHHGLAHRPFREASRGPST